MFYGKNNYKYNFTTSAYVAWIYRFQGFVFVFVYLLYYLFVFLLFHISWMVDMGINVYNVFDYRNCLGQGKEI